MAYYTIRYDANGGYWPDGAPSNQTKEPNVSITLISDTPAKNGYSFNGWALSVNAMTALYHPEDTYTNNSSVTLYAVWDQANFPIITNLSAYLCNSLGVALDTGTTAYAKVSFVYSSPSSVSSIYVDYKLSTASDSAWVTSSVSGSNNQVAKIIGSNALRFDRNYDIRVRVTNTVGTTTAFYTISAGNFALDFLSGGTGAAMGKVAELSGIFEVNWQTLFTGGIKNKNLSTGVDLNTLRVPNTYISYGTTSDYSNIPSGIGGGTFVLEVMSAGQDNQILQRLTRCHQTLPYVYIRLYHMINGSYTWGSWIQIYPDPNVSSLPSIVSQHTTQITGNAQQIASLYYAKNSSVQFRIDTAGYITSAKKDLYFAIPLAKPIGVGVTAATISSVSGLRIRQNNKYLYGSSDSAWTSPNRYRADLDVYGRNHINCIASFTADANAENNSACGVAASIQVTFT